MFGNIVDFFDPFPMNLQRNLMDLHCIFIGNHEKMQRNRTNFDRAKIKEQKRNFKNPSRIANHN